MTSRDFCYWLQGYFELRNGANSGWSTEQAAMVRAHLNMVFAHEIDPSFPSAQQGQLSKLHDAATAAQGLVSNPHDQLAIAQGATSAAQQLQQFNPHDLRIKC